jgi:hypothetical protein
MTAVLSEGGMEGSTSRLTICICHLVVDLLLLWHCRNRRSRLSLTDTSCQRRTTMAKKTQKRAPTKRSRPVGKRDLVRRPRASSYAKPHGTRTLQRNG